MTINLHRWVCRSDKGGNPMNRANAPLMRAYGLKTETARRGVMQKKYDISGTDCCEHHFILVFYSVYTIAREADALEFRLDPNAHFPAIRAVVPSQ